MNSTVLSLKSFSVCIFLILQMLLSTSVYSQLSGTKFIGSGGDYLTFAAATAALKTQGVSGPVIFGVYAGTYSEQIHIGNITGVSATNTITFMSATGNPASVIVTSSASPVVLIDSADYVTFQDMTFTQASTTTGNVFDIRNSAKHTSIKNSIINGAVLTANYNVKAAAAIFNDQNAIGTLLNIDSLTVDNNIINNGSYGVYLNGIGTGGVRTPGLIISNNVLSNQYYTGIMLNTALHPVITGNAVTSNSTYSNYIGYELQYCEGSAIIANNREFNFSGSDIEGIRIANRSLGYAETALIYNNDINVYGTGGIIRGLYMYNINSAASAINNSIYAGGASGTILGISTENGGASLLSLTNNIAIAHTSSTAYALYVTNTALINVCDYNRYHSTATNLAYWTTPHTSLASLQGANGKDIHSTSGNVNFVAANNLHLSGASLADLTLQCPRNGNVLVDKDGLTRSITATNIGAYQRPAPYAPSPLYALASSSTQIDLTWTDNATTETNYYVKRSLSFGSGYVVIDTLPANSTSYNNDELSASTIYYYMVEAADSGIYSGNSNVAYDTTFLATNIHESVASITLHPNPTHGMLSLTFSQGYDSDAIVAIYNTAGALVYTRSFEKPSQGSQYSIDLQSLTDGLYMISIKTNNETMKKQFVIVK